MYFNKKKEEENRSNLSVKFVPYQRFDTAAEPQTHTASHKYTPKKENNTLSHNTRRCKTHTHSVEQQFFCMNLCETGANDETHECEREKRKVKKVNQIEL